MDRREFMRMMAAVAAGLAAAVAGIGIAAGPTAAKAAVAANMMPVGIIAGERIGDGQLVMVGPDGRYYTICSSFGDIVEVMAEAVQLHRITSPQNESVWEAEE